MTDLLDYQRFDAPEGAQDAAPLLIAHGLFGSGRNWTALARRFSRSRPVVTVDMRNHGQSFRSASQDYRQMAGDLSRIIAHFGTPMDVLGHSMGGKAAMLLALDAPERVGRLIVADIAPVGYSHTHAPYIDAMQRLDLSTLGRRSEADAALAREIEDPALRAFLLQSLKFEPGAPPRWLLNLETLSREMPHLVGFPEVSGEFAGPTLFVSGGASDYVQSGHRPLIRGLFPAAEFETVPGAGHWLHAEAPGPFVETVDSFLADS